MLHQQSQLRFTAGRGRRGGGGRGGGGGRRGGGNVGSERRWDVGALLGRFFAAARCSWRLDIFKKYFWAWVRVCCTDLVETRVVIWWYFLPYKSRPCKKRACSSLVHRPTMVGAGVEAGKAETAGSSLLEKSGGGMSNAFAVLILFSFFLIDTTTTSSWNPLLFERSSFDWGVRFLFDMTSRVNTLLWEEREGAGGKINGSIKLFIVIKNVYRGKKYKDVHSKKESP